MRSFALAVLICIAVPAALAFAQENTNNSVQKQNFVTAANSQRPRIAPQARYEDSDDGVCYTMRTYYFQRQDGNAPVPTGMTTCTRISQRDLKHVDHAPKARLLPAMR